MTTQQIIRESLYILASFLIPILIFACFSAPPQSIFVSDIYVAAQPSPGQYHGFLNRLNPFVGLMFLFPLLFCLNTVRLFFERFGPHYLVVFHLFISAISLCLSLIAASFIHALVGIFLDTAIIYPPLSALNSEHAIVNEVPWIWEYGAYLFCLFHVLVIVLLIRRLAVPK